MTETYEIFFERMTSSKPHSWQKRLGAKVSCTDRLIRIPTGLGKTAGTMLPWLFHRVEPKDAAWPMRLAFSLPMRTLVEQTERVINGWLSTAKLEEVGLHVLMGGVEASKWRQPAAGLGRRRVGELESIRPGRRSGVSVRRCFSLAGPW